MKTQQSSREELEQTFDYYGFTTGNEMWQAAMDYANAEKERVLRETDESVEGCYYTPLLDKHEIIWCIRQDIKKKIKETRS